MLTRYVATFIFVTIAVALLINYGEKQKAKRTNLQDPIVVALGTAETGDILILREDGKITQRFLIARLEEGEIIGEQFAFVPYGGGQNSGFLLFGVGIPYGQPVKSIDLIKKNDWLKYGSAMELMIQEAIVYSQGKK